ncbi:MAG: hypothetical protein EA398_05070 [Deltaproteobacteria bacterium]|nr:MAG: hypothetical protein EA398_05070 [Deltaproteobacteria bacterium]
MSAQKETPEFAERPGWGGAGYIVAMVLILSVVLGIWFGRQYVTFLGHVRDTLHEPDTPHSWQLGPVAPEQCVDEALAWAARCTGIKTLCDMYVSHFVELCLDAHDRRSYCRELQGRHVTTDFGVLECQARGVRRHLDDQACNNAYRQIDTHCTRILEGSGAEAP